MQNTFTTPKSARAGFTLSEILLAMLVFAIAISTILALLARSIESVDEIVLKDEAMRISSALEQELQTMSFADVYTQVLPGRVFQAFHYRVDANQNPRISRDGTVGVDYLVVPFIGTGQTVSSNEFQAREGRFFLVNLVVSPTNPLGNTSLPATSDTYASAALVLYAEFHAVGSPAQQTPPTTPPVFSYNFAVRR